jgi:MFS family permease
MKQATTLLVRRNEFPGDDVHNDARVHRVNDPRRGFYVLYSTLFLQGIGMSIMFATLPPTARELGISVTQMGWVFMTPAVLWALTAPGWGRRSDVWGRRPLLLLGTGAFSLSMFIIAIAVDARISGAITSTAFLGLLMLSRGTFGLLGGGAPPSAQGYIADQTSRVERTRAMASLGAAQNLGQLFGPGLGGVLVLVSLSFPYYVIGITTALGMLSILFLLPMSHHSSHPRPDVARKRPKIQFWDKRIAPLTVVAALVNFAIAAIWQTQGFYIMDVLGFSAEKAAQYAGASFMIIAIAGLAVRFLAIPLFDMSAILLVRLGTVLLTAAFLVLTLADNLWHLGLAVLFVGLGSGMAWPGIVSAFSLAVEPDEQGTAAGLVGALASIGHIISPLTTLQLYQLNPVLPYVVILGLLVLASAAAILHPQMRRIAVRS